MNPIRTIASLALLSFIMAIPVFGAATFGKPVVTVYPLTFAGAEPGNSAGADVALILATRLADGSSVIVKPYIPGSVRSQYLENAIASRADYYVTGFLQAIGSDVSMILQVVSTHSGSVVFSTTTTISTYGDAAAQADPIREAILRHAGRGYAALDAPAAVPSPSEAPANAGINLTKALRKRQKAAPTPAATATSDAELVPVSQIARVASSASPSPMPATPPPAPVTPLPVTPVPVQPVPTVAVSAHAVAVATTAATPSVRTSMSVSTALVLDTEGQESDGDRTEASEAFLLALRATGIHAARLAISATETHKNAPSICHANVGAERFYAPSLIVGHDDGGRVLARLSVEAIDCTGTTIAQQTIAATPKGRTSAIDRAAQMLAPSIGRL